MGFGGFFLARGIGDFGQNMGVWVNQIVVNKLMFWKWKNMGVLQRWWEYG